LDFIDTSVLVAAVVASEPHHAACGRFLDGGGLGLFVHGLAEFFSTLTGGRKAFRLSPDQAAEILEAEYAFPCNTGRFQLCIQVGSDHDHDSHHPRQPAVSVA